MILRAEEGAAASGVEQRRLRS